MGIGKPWRLWRSVEHGGFTQFQPSRVTVSLWFYPIGKASNIPSQRTYCPCLLSTLIGSPCLSGWSQLRGWIVQQTILQFTHKKSANISKKPDNFTNPTPHQRVIPWVALARVQSHPSASWALKKLGVKATKKDQKIGLDTMYPAIVRAAAIQ
jgi:hypothetical protein